jgi:hypothetical protein
MILPDITDLIGKRSSDIGGPLRRPCLWVVEEVYRRMGLTMSLLDFEANETQWQEVAPESAPVGATLGIERAVPGFVEHFAINLGWGLCLHATHTRIELANVSDLNVIEAYYPCSLL